MSHALELYKADKIRVACAISHYDETTLALCLNSIARMQARFSGQRVISGKTPMCESFNASLDFACDIGADILFHTAADVIVEPAALLELLKVMDTEDNYLALARGYDSIFGVKAPVGIWIWNMRIVGRQFRFRDVFKQDIDICQRIEAATGKSRVYTPEDRILGYHHPIWTAEELFTKYRYSLPKYADKRPAKIMRGFLEKGLKLEPTNKALLAGLRGARAAEQHGALGGAKDNAALHDEFLEMTRDLALNGTECYVADKRFEQQALDCPHEVSRVAAELELLRSEVDQLRHSFSYQLGRLLVQAVAKPGRNTVLLPHKLLCLTRLAVSTRRKARGL